MQVFLGTVMPFPYNFVPYGWMACNGQILPISSFATLYSLLGVAYGGNGTTTFALPSLNNTGTGLPSYVVAGQGAGPGRTPRTIGQVVGENNHTLLPTEMASHNHPMTLYGGLTNRVATPSAGATLIDPAYTGFMPSNTPPATTFNPQTVAMNGGSQGHPNNQPALQLYFCICYQGFYPNFNS